MELPPDQDCANVKIPPPLIFFAFLCVAGALEYGVGLNFSWGPIGVWRSIALVLFLFSGYLALHSVVILKKRGTFVDPNKPTIQMVTEGPFRISRNPMYLSLILVLFGFSVWFSSIWFLLSAIALWLVFNWVAVPPEEVYLEKKFGEQYTAYKSRVRRWF
jgi:protein-S-isoprenylcysteine O-methyltransferase Ste14